MICPICNLAELELLPGKRMLGGWLVRPDVLTCPDCKSRAEVTGDRLRHIYVPGVYAVFLGDSLAGVLSPEDARSRGARARVAVQRRHELRRGELKPVERCAFGRWSWAPAKAATTAASAPASGTTASPTPAVLYDAAGTEVDRW